MVRTRGIEEGWRKGERSEGGEEGGRDDTGRRTHRGFGAEPGEEEEEDDDAKAERVVVWRCKGLLASAQKRTMPSVLRRER